MSTSSPPLSVDAALVAERFAAVRERVSAAARAAGRDPADVRLLVATKTRTASAVRAVVAAGADLVGENRVQELVAKAPGIADLVAAGLVTVHMIGNLQRNKAGAVLAAGTNVAAVETVDTLALAEALSSRCLRLARALDVMVQVNVSGEATKAGTTPDDAADLAERVAALPGLRLTGFMTIGANTPDETRVRDGFACLRAIRDGVLAGGAPGTDRARDLSMGMSGDLEPAIAEGATIVRVGSAVFGPRAVPG